VTATASGASTPATFALTNNAVTTSANYVFYASGQDTGGGTGANYYAIAGALTIDSNGNVLGGEEDYNDAFGITSPNEPTPDTISGGTLSMDPTTGLGTLTITSSYTATGALGVQEFAVQFVNPNHALIMQFDGSATSSGSLDLQSATAVSAPTFAFAMSGIDNTTSEYMSWDFGGVFTASTGAGFVDVNDGGTVSIGNALTSTSGAPDTTFGRNVVTVSVPAISLVTYPVGPSVMRMIDVDVNDTAVGSAFGQGSGSFDNTSLTAGVFAEIGQWSWTFATVGQFATDSNGNITSGIADDNELDNGVQLLGNDITGSSYDLVSSGVNGYGSMTLTNSSAVDLNGDVTLLGVYMVDPTLNINDPNNTTTDATGGALIVDLSSSGVTPGGMGVISPQTDTTSTDFSGNYAAGFQNFNYFSVCGDCEFDMVGPFTMASGGALATASIGADDSDPFGTISGVESKGDPYGPTAPLPVVAGYFTMQASPLAATIDGLSGGFSVDIFQASATTLYWINIDTNDDTVFLGTLQGQSSVVKARAAKRSATRIQPQRKVTTSKFGTYLR
jgi:hypothetical protein